MQLLAYILTGGLLVSGLGIILMLVIGTSAGSKLMEYTMSVAIIYVALFMMLCVIGLLLAYGLSFIIGPVHISHWFLLTLLVPVVVLVMYGLLNSTSHIELGNTEVSPVVASDYTNRPEIEQFLLKDSLQGDEKERVARSLAQLFKAEEHIMMQFVGRPATEVERDKRKETLLRDYRVQLWVNMQVRTQKLPIVFPIKKGGIYFDIKRLKDYSREDVTYEYWMTQVASVVWAGTHSTQIFTVIKQSDTSREVVYTSNTFEPVIVTDDLEQFQLPVDDASFVYALSPQGWSAIYKGTVLEGVEVVFQDGKKIIKN